MELRLLAENLQIQADKLPVVAEFYRLCGQLRELLTQAGIHTLPTTRFQTWSRFDQISLDRLEALNRQLRLSHVIYSEAIEGSVDGYDERVALRRALDFYGIYADSDSMKLVDRDDIIEIYDQDSNQLYRSLNFFKTTGYSLEDLLLNEWYVLWERPSWVFESLMGSMTGLIRGQMPNVNLNVPEHLIREIYQNEQNPDGQRLLLVQMKYGMPYREKGSQKIGGVICTSQCKVLETNTSQAPTGISFL